MASVILELTPDQVGVVKALLDTVQASPGSATIGQVYAMGGSVWLKATAISPITVLKVQGATREPGAVIYRD